MNTAKRIATCGFWMVVWTVRGIGWGIGAVLKLLDVSLNVVGSSQGGGR